MDAVGAVLIDFDGSACSHDVAEHLLNEFGDPSWPSFDDAWLRGEIDARTALQAQANLLSSDRVTMTRFALDHCPMDPTFAPFVKWATSQGLSVAIASDGFGFYIEPLLRAAGVAAIDVITNEQTWDEHRMPAGLSFPNGHPDCIGCGTCKMGAVLKHHRVHGPVAYVGEGDSDRYASLFADLVFAKDDLTAHCLRDGVPAIAWSDFDDVRDVLESATSVPGPVSPVVCPGWTPA